MDYLIAVIFTFLGVLCIFPMKGILNKMPAKCFCDYGETPDHRHAAPRITEKQAAVSALLLGMMFSLLAVRFGLSLQTVALCLFSVTLLMIALSDIRFCIIPDELIIAGCVFAVTAAIPGVLSGGTVGQCLAPLFGLLIGGGIILLINLLGCLVYKKDALGMGDAKLMAMCGIACGVGGTVIALFIGMIAAAIWFAIGILRKRTKTNAYLPLGPFLAFGAGFTICCQPLVDRFLAWYISLI